MTALPVTIPAGIVVDDTTFSTGAAAWYDADKVRFWRAQPQVIGGWATLVDEQLTGVCRGIYAWTDNAWTQPTRQINIAFGTNAKLYVYLNEVLYDITPTAGFVPGLVDGVPGTAPPAGVDPTVIGYIAVAGNGVNNYTAYAGGDGVNYIVMGPAGIAPSYPLTWSLANYGQTLMANPRGQSIFQWNNDPATPAIRVMNAPANVNTMLVTYTRQVMAFGCNEETSGVYNPRAIRFSDIEDPTDWTTLSSNNAGEVIIQGSGQIVGARTIGEYLFVWTTSTLYLGTYTGQQSNPWTFTAQGENCGLIGPNAAVVVNDQLAYWMSTNGQFFYCTLGGVPTVLTCPIQADVSSHIAPLQQEKVFCSSCSEFAEVRWDYPDSRDASTGAGENSRYVAYNAAETAWTRGTMVRTAYMDAGPTQTPVAVDAAGDVYQHEVGQTANGAVIDAWIETADMYLGDQFVPTQGFVQGDQVVMVNGIWPDIASQVGTVAFSVMTRLYPQGQQRLKGPYTLTPAQRRRDFQIKGRIARMRYEANTAAAPYSTFFRIGKSVYDVQPTGIR